MIYENRRTALKTIGATFAAGALPVKLFIGNGSRQKPVRLGVIADLHGGLAVDAEKRLDEFLDAMAQEKVDALIQLGDFAYPNQKFQRFSDKFNSAHPKTIHVIGNHEFDFSLTREDCYRAWGIESAFYRSDVEGLRLIVLDGNESGSPNYISGYHSYIGKQQQAWLANELSSTDRPVIVLCHQPLAGESAIDNASEIQDLLAEFNDKILLCLNGHSHVDSLLQVKGVSYLHINSASYYWVGGEKRMSYYNRPLFTTLTFDPANSSISVEGCISSWKDGDAPASVNYFDRDDAPPETIVVPAIREREINFSEVRQAVTTKPQISRESEVDSLPTLKIMTWNIWGRLNQDPRYTVDKQTARERAIDVIRESGADLIAMIETYGSASDIAEALGYHFYTPAADANLCIFSRYPLSDFGSLEGLSSFSFIGATITLPSGQKIRVYDVWLTSSGRHIVEIKNKQLSDQEFCSGDDVRFTLLEKFLEHTEFKMHLANSAEVPVVVAGDFNCVSHLDHTAATKHSQLNHSRILPIKVSKAMHKAGFTDSFRAANPDIFRSTLGYTWTTVGLEYQYAEGKGFIPVEDNPAPEYRNPYARIDFVYSAGDGLQPIASKVISHHPSELEGSFPEFPSDHAAVLTEFMVDLKIEIRD